MEFVQRETQLKYPTWISGRLKRIQRGLVISDLQRHFEKTFAYHHIYIPARDFYRRCKRYIRKHLLRR